MERTKREFVSIAAHQLRTPLTSMKWAVDYLIEGAKGELAIGQKALANQALHAANRMIHLVDDLLDVSRVEEGRFGINPSLQTFYPVLDRVFEVFQKKAAEKEISISSEIEKDIPALRFDEDKLEIVLDNVTDNAIKYTPQKGTIKVSLKKEGVNVVLAVRDSGIGIPKEDFERIFTKFFRSPQALAHHTDGSGLGLYVAKNIIDQHGGKIWFESEENVGTTFFISLPLLLG
jgi:two-component system sensor histidine kinase VicK